MPESQAADTTTPKDNLMRSIANTAADRRDLFLAALLAPVVLVLGAIRMIRVGR